MADSTARQIVAHQLDLAGRSKRGDRSLVTGKRESALRSLAELETRLVTPNSRKQP